MVYASCDICGSGKYREVIRVEISPLLVPSWLVRCAGCGFFYANPRLNREAEEDYYTGRYHEDQKEGYWYDGRIDVFRRSLSRMHKFLKNGRMVDVGCGMGYFMDLARKHGWETKGVDISTYAAGHANEKLGLDVVKGTLKDARFESEYFDAATMWNVLDQIYDPAANLTELNRVLKKGGYLFIRMPNLYFHLRMLKFHGWLKYFLKDLKARPAVFHLYAFDKNSVKRLLESTGFSDVAVRTERIGVNVPRFVEIFGKGNEKTVRKIFDTGAEGLYRLSLGKIVMSPSIFVIARKKDNAG